SQVSLFRGADFSFSLGKSWIPLISDPIEGDLVDIKPDVERFVFGLLDFSVIESVSVSCIFYLTSSFNTIRRKIVNWFWTEQCGDTTEK
ncbi:hypothetical protein Goklo_027740, partial [Gossypium klotzschianum]|nr:hypothetical protein [Gossypium klotzschianum]